MKSCFETINNLELSAAIFLKSLNSRQGDSDKNKPVLR